MMWKGHEIEAGNTRSHFGHNC